MRKLFVAAAVTTGLILAAATAAAQVLPPAVPARVPSPPAVAAPGPAALAVVPVGLAAHHARMQRDPLLSAVAFDGSAEAQAIGALRVLLRDRGFGPDVTAGPMTALPPGAAVHGARHAPDDELEALVTTDQPEAWLVQTDAGRWWLWESGAAAPADLRAQVYQVHAARRALAEGHVLD